MTLQLFWPIEKIDRETREVYGYASTEAQDSQGEIVLREALEAALPAYMRFANIREMHMPSAVGVAKEAVVDKKGLWLKAHIVDDDAWRKVRAGVYKGFSIGGMVTRRDAVRPHVVTGVELTEISLVDRPANPETVFAVWKSADGKKEASVHGIDRLDGDRLDGDRLDGVALKDARRRLAQKWVATDGSAFERAEDAMRHEALLASGDAGSGGALAKTSFAEASEPTSGLTHYDLEGAGSHGAPTEAGPYADPGFQPDHEKRYPIGDEKHIRAAWLFINHPDHQKPYTADQVAHIKTMIIAAWKAKIDPDGPPAARGKAAAAGDLSKALPEVARLATLIDELQWLRASAARANGDRSAVPEDFDQAITAMCGVLYSMVEDQVALIDDDDDEEDDALARGAGLGRRRGALAKAGARHHDGDDHDAIQRIHDHAVALGASCHGDKGRPTAKMDGGSLATLRARTVALEDQFGAALPLIREVKAMVEKVAAQPAVVPPSRLIAVDKGADVARELERIAGQPPAVTAFELIKRAVREPLPFGARLGETRE